ncbi:hypothetical protein NSA38_15030 [Enterococcus faecalis]|nr:hypothetical protein [Enterococcus faecalis]MCR1938559.1 hypothetical protein [Enterococcus faecalis]
MEYTPTYPICDPETDRLLYVGEVRMQASSILAKKKGNILRKN